MEKTQELPYNIIEAWNGGEWDALEALHTKDWIDHTSPPGMNDLAGLKQLFMLMWGAFPDLNGEIVNVVIDNGSVAYQYIIKGTHQGDFMGIPATGKKVDFRGMTILNAVDGKCVEAWGLMDQMTMMQQLGAVPTSGE